MRKLKKSKTPLTMDTIRTYPGLENLSDEEAREAVDSIHKLSLLLYDLIRKGAFNELSDDGKAEANPKV